MHSEQEWVYFGQHKIRFEPPDNVRFVGVGFFTLEAAQSYLDFIFATADQHGNVYLLLDCARTTAGMPPEVRTLLTRPPRPYPFHGIAAYNANFTMRVIITMVIKAGTLLFPSKFAFPVAFFASEQEAAAQVRAWRASRERGQK